MPSTNFRRCATIRDVGWTSRRSRRDITWTHYTSSNIFSTNRSLGPTTYKLELYRTSAYQADFHAPAQPMDSTLGNSLDPHSYTSGRWLYRDKLERDGRYISFDFDALCQRVVELCPGAVSIATYEKKEGGFNRVFLFTTDNAMRVVAKLPFKLAGPPKLTTGSEVATMKYLQLNTSVPSPRILDWSDDDSNAIGSEYIIMEHAKGVQLHEKWPALAGDQQIRCIDAIYRKFKEIIDMEFPAYGSLYFRNAAYNFTSRLPVNQEICVGPHCGARYWDCDPGERRYYHNAEPNQGPWFDLAAYCNGLVDAGISRIPFTFRAQDRPSYHGSPQAHLQLLQSCRTVILKMSKDRRIRNAAVPTLLHPDLHKRNIFVSEDDPSIITDIIDWQSSSVEPAFWYVDEIPDFAEFDQNEGCAKAFDACTHYLVPKLSGPRLMEEALFRPYRYCHRTWKDGAVALRHDLIETSKGWKCLGFEGSCPFPPLSAEELAGHQQKYEKFKAAQNLRYDLMGLLNTASDGWVPTKDWKVTKSAHRDLFNGMLEAVVSNKNPDIINVEEDLREIWPFDL